MNWGTITGLMSRLSLQAGIQYSLEASISGPLSGYGQFGSSRVEDAGVVFLFANKAGAKEFEDTTVSQG